jgi:electron transport complex protein RnfC
LNLEQPAVICAAAGVVERLQHHPATALAAVASPVCTSAFWQIDIRPDADASTPAATALLTPLDLTQLVGSADARTQIIKRLANAGICGLGGGGFDTARKFAAVEQAKLLIINGMQSEPDNLCDSWLLEQAPEAVASGIALSALATEAQKIIVALPVESAPPQAFATLLQNALLELQLSISAEIKRLPVNHASGEEHRLCEAVGGPRLEYNSPLTCAAVLCLNIGTVHAIHLAVRNGEPLLRRVVTVARHPRWVWIGTAFIDLCPLPVWVNGSDGGDIPTGSAINASHYCVASTPPKQSYGCINCGACEPVCPVKLHPDSLYKAVSQTNNASRLKTVTALNIDACLECGACNAVCPSALPLAQAFRNARKQLQFHHHRDREAHSARQRWKARTARLDRQTQRIDGLQRAREQLPRQW